MALSDIILKPYQLLLTEESESGVGITLDNSNFTFGTVAKTSGISDYYAVDDRVMYDPNEKSIIKIIDSGTTYILIQEKYVFATLNYIAP